MKNTLLISFCFLATLFSKAQTISTFESLTLAKDSFWNGSEKPLGTTFTNGLAEFKNYFDTSYGGYWTGGWAYSNMTDTITPDYNNLYSARPGVGYNGSNNYLVGQQNSMIKLNGNALGKVVEGLYITNSTYATYSLEDGDFVSKKFGGVNGTDKDFFKLIIRKYLNGTLSNDSVVFYLADYRSDDDTKDYIVKDWRWVNLTSLGNVDSLTFELVSSDNGQFGMNTPGFFCIDNFTSTYPGLNIAKNLTLFSILYPNPVIDFLTLEFQNKQNGMAEINISDITGCTIKTFNSSLSHHKIDVSEWTNGLYFVKTTINQTTSTQTFVKQ